LEVSEYFDEFINTSYGTLSVFLSMLLVLTLAGFDEYFG